MGLPAGVPVADKQGGCPAENSKLVIKWLCVDLRHFFRGSFCNALIINGRSMTAGCIVLKKSLPARADALPGQLPLFAAASTPSRTLTVRDGDRSQQPSRVMRGCGARSCPARTVCPCPARTRSATGGPTTGPPVVEMAGFRYWSAISWTTSSTQHGSKGTGGRRSPSRSGMTRGQKNNGVPTSRRRPAIPF